MGRKSTREDKTIYQESREAAELTRQEAGERMGFVSEDRIEKIESEKSEARPDEVLAMAECYGDAMLCNRHCATMCPIGRQYVPMVQDKELSQITLESVSAINILHTRRDEFINIAAEGLVSEKNQAAFEEINAQLERISQSVSSLQLWFRKKAMEAEEGETK